MNNVLITGISGFAGSRIAENLVNNNYTVIGLKRQSTNIWRCEEFKNKIIWVDIDDEKKYKEKIISLGIDILIHCAWLGVESKDRDSWATQVQNFVFLSELLEMSKKASVNNVIILGSQSEYGKFEGEISETYDGNPIDAYGTIKLACLELTKNFAKINDVKWVWVRLFSLFGEKESLNWLIPSTIKSIKNKSSLDLTFGEQRYAYLYIRDFAQIIFKIIEKNIDSGIYNISSNSALSIKTLISLIKNKVNPSFELNFGSLEYRKNQSMHIQGDINKLESQIGSICFTDFDTAIQNTINFYLKH